MFGRVRRFFFLCLLLLATPVWGAEVPKDYQLLTAEKVRAIFEAKCIECHGPEVPRPKKFGYVLDLNRMAENPDYVERGKPEKSELFLMVDDDEMPGENAGVPPLTPWEKQVVKNWIAMGAPGDLPGAEPPAEAATPGKGTALAKPAAAAPSGPPPLPLWEQTLRWLGKFHPLSTHFPVALMLVAAFAEGLVWWSRREEFFVTVRFLVLIAALGAIGATILGWFNAAYFHPMDSAWTFNPKSEQSQTLWWHRWTGTGVGVWALICAFLTLISKCEEGTSDRRRFRGALIFGAVLVAISGFLGGAIVAGTLSHYGWK